MVVEEGVVVGVLVVDVVGEGVLVKVVVVVVVCLRALAFISSSFRPLRRALASATLIGTGLVGVDGSVVVIVGEGVAEVEAYTVVVGGEEVVGVLVVIVVEGEVIGGVGEKNFAVVGGGAWCSRQYASAKACLRRLDHCASFFFFFLLLFFWLSLLKMGKGGGGEFSFAASGTWRRGAGTVWGLSLATRERRLYIGGLRNCDASLAARACAFRRVGWCALHTFLFAASATSWS